jgi:hypothetical protein
VTLVFRLFLLLPLGAALFGCASADGERAWPSLAPRPGEISPMVPRVPLGACAGCGPDMVSEQPVVSAPQASGLAAPVRPDLPADIDERLTRIEAGIAAVEAAWPGARAAALAAIADAGGGARETEADVQASRFEALFQPLGQDDSALTALAVILPEAEGGEAYAARLATLQARLSALERVRAAGLAGETSAAISE